MKRLKEEMKSIAKSLVSLSKQVEKLSKELGKLPKTGNAPAAKKSVARPAAGKPMTVLESVFDIVKRSRKGVTIAQLKEKTGLKPRQLSNALYKLSNKGQVYAKERGVYVKK
ncbi:MAG: hypothetical protein JSW39_05585 [Desulfobacterales bacterium]|nr:MAG: hypothetical protein JSW39_05585 [Desulfobacterales bacterium]